MSVYTGCLLALLVGGLGPGLVLVSMGKASERLVGLEVVAAAATFALITFSQVGRGQSYDLILPLVLVPLSFAGTLVFTRLISQQDE